MFGLALSVEILLAFTLCIVLGGNNLSTCLGTSMGSRTLNYSRALMLASAGLLAGIIIEGSKLSGAITSGIVSSQASSFLVPVSGSSLLVMSVLTYRRLPISLSQVAVGAALGSALARGITPNVNFTSLVIFSWLLTPAVGFMITAAISLLTTKAVKRMRNILALNAIYGYLTILSGIYASYTLGANTVGLIIGLVDAPNTTHPFLAGALGIATVIGMITLSKGTSRSVAENIVGLSPSASFAAQMGGAITVHSFTQFGIPVSVSQAVVGGIFGAAATRKIVVRNDRLTKEILFGWTAAPLLGAVLALGIAVIM